MKWFESKTRLEIEELKAEIDSLRTKIRQQELNTELRIGELPQYFMWDDPDPRPKIQLKDVVLMLTERLKLEIKQTPGVAARTVIERKPKTPNAKVSGAGTASAGLPG